MTLSSSALSPSIVMDTVAPISSPCASARRVSNEYIAALLDDISRLRRMCAPIHARLTEAYEHGISSDSLRDDAAMLRALDAQIAILREEFSRAVASR